MDVLKDVIREWVPLATFVIALAALVSGIVAICQFVLARQQFARMYRPELIVPLCVVCWRSGPADGVPEERRGLGACFTVVNKGAGEARIVAMRAAILLTDPQNVGDYLLDLPIERRTLVSGERIELAVFVDPEYDGFVPHISGPIRCIGYIIYKDAAGRQRETGFARRYDTVGKRWIREEGSQHDYAY